MDSFKRNNGQAQADPVAQEGQEAVEVELQAVDVPILFPLAKAQAKDPTMQKSLTDGLANSLGLEKEQVTITKIGTL